MTRGYGKGKSPKKFAFTYNQIGEAAGLSSAAVRKHAQRGNFNPKNLLSVLEFINHRLQSPPVVESDIDSEQLIKKLETVTERGKRLPRKFK